MLWIQNLFLISLLLMPGIVSAQPISLAEVIRETIFKSPDIPLSQLNTDLVKTEQQRIEGILDPNYTMRVSHSDETIPTANPFAADQTQFSQLTGAITLPFQDGSTLTGSVDYSRNCLIAMAHPLR